MATTTTTTRRLTRRRCVTPCVGHVSRLLSIRSATQFANFEYCKQSQGPESRLCAGEYAMLTKTVTMTVTVMVMVMVTASGDCDSDYDQSVSLGSDYGFHSSFCNLIKQGKQQQ